MESHEEKATDVLASRDGLVLNRPPKTPAGLLAFLSTRIGGESHPPWDSLNAGTRVGDSIEAVRRNQRRIGHLIGCPPTAWARIHMEHGTRVLEARDPGTIGLADGLLTTRPRIPLAITVADCFPLFLWAPGSGAALLHCGWRGVARGIAENGVKSLALATGTSPEAFGAWIGPGIRPCCYEVGWDVAIQVSPHSPFARGRIHLDLPREIRRRLEAAGLESRRISESDHCTSCRPHFYFSHRRDRGRTGRMLAVLALEPSYFGSTSSK
jgi:YfiH family protein